MIKAVSLRAGLITAALHWRVPFWLTPGRPDAPREAMGCNGVTPLYHIGPVAICLEGEAETFLMSSKQGLFGVECLIIHVKSLKNILSRLLFDPVIQAIRNRPQI